MIRCPKTGKPLPTGIAADQSSFDSSQFVDNSVNCPHCGGTHTWNKPDAFFSESPPKDDRTSAK